MVLEFLLRHHARTASGGALRMARRHCEAMARGGIYDQLGGGFARYSRGRRWMVPHFEKMLYDNALLCRVYAHLWRATGSPLARRVAEETADFLIRELRTAEGGFASSLDADSEGGRARTSRARTTSGARAAREALGDGTRSSAAELFGVTAAGTFEQGTSVLRLAAGPTPGDRGARGPVRRALLAARDGRPRPGRDDKVVAAWNGLAIAALAETGVLFDRPT